MRSQIINTLLLIFLCSTLSSCMFPGTLIRFNRTTETYVTDSLKVVDKDFDYFCFDWEDCKCTQMKETTIDTGRNNILKIDVIKATRFARDGRHQRIRHTKIFDVNGKLQKRTKQILQSKGKSGRELFFKEIEYLEDGRIKVTKRRQTWHGSERPEKVKYRGKKK